MRVFRYVRDRLERMRALRRVVDAGLLEDPRASERSLNLLLRCLSPAQRAEFERSRAFKVRGKSGQKYKITYGTTANIEVLAPSGTVARRLCAGPLGVPVPAAMLAQKLMLETQESEFLRIAAHGPGTTAEAAFFTGASRRYS